MAGKAFTFCSFFTSFPIKKMKMLCFSVISKKDFQNKGVVEEIQGLEVVMRRNWPRY